MLIPTYWVNVAWNTHFGSRDSAWWTILFATRSEPAMAIRVEMGPRRNRSVVRALLGGIVCAGLSVTGFVIVITGAPIAGGIPFLPQALNQGIGRVVFALGALFVGLMAVYAFHEAWRLLRERGSACRIDE